MKNKLSLVFLITVFSLMLSENTHSRDVTAAAAKKTEANTRFFLPVADPHDLGWGDLKETLNSIIPEDGALDTDAFLLVHHGKLLIERYRNGYAREKKHILWSMTKSVTAALMVIAESEGKLSREDPVSRFFPEAKGSVWDAVKISNLLSMSSGVEFNESYEMSPFQSNVVAMLYRFPFAQDMGTYRLSVNRKLAEPGMRFNYASGESNLVSKILKKTLGQDYDEYPWKKLFDPIGATSFTFERDASGTFIGSSYGYASSEDLIRFGYLLLKKGQWIDSKRVLPEDSVKFFSTLSPGLFHAGKKKSYGHGFWLNQAIPERGIRKPVPAGPDDLFSAEGHKGQYLYISPSLDLVILRLANDGYRNHFKPSVFFENLRKVMPK